MTESIVGDGINGLTVGEPHGIGGIRQPDTGVYVNSNSLTGFWSVKEQPFTVNKLCLEPFPDKSTKVEMLGEGEFKVAKVSNTKTSLVKLKLLRDCRWTVSGGYTQFIKAGSHVWIRASEYASPWGKEVLAAGDERFIMVPPDRIEYVEPI